MERDKMPDSREGLLNLLQEWRGFAEWACNIHNSRQSRYAYLNFILGIPIAVLSISVGGGTIALFEESLGTTFRVLTAVFSLVAAVLAALQTFVKPSEKSKERQIAATVYLDLVRDMDQCLADPPDSVKELDQQVSEFNDRLDKLQRDSPGLPVRRHQASRGSG